MRADAQRNRQRLIEVARQAFAAGEAKVSLEAVAREAGVGIGTLYRHFPTRESLVEAVYRAERSSLCAAADELLAAQQPPDRALRTWMDRFADYIATKREMAEALRALIASGAVTRSEVREELSVAVRRLLDAGAANGDLRPDACAEDIVVALVGIVVVCPLPDQRAQAGRLFDLLMDGLRGTGRAAGKSAGSDPRGLIDSLKRRAFERQAVTRQEEVVRLVEDQAVPGVRRGGGSPDLPADRQ